MILTIHNHHHSRDETIIHDGYGYEIPHKWIDFDKVEVDDMYAETARISFIFIPRGATPEEIAYNRAKAIRGF